MRSRAIYGCAGFRLSAAEQNFFRETRPWGFILFARNISDSEQIKALIGELRETVEDRSAPVLIDQEGGRVARLGPPQWHERPPAARFGALYAQNPEVAWEACYLNARLIAHDLASLGINVDCLPVLDVPDPQGHEIIGDRAYAHDNVSGRGSLLFKPTDNLRIMLRGGNLLSGSAGSSNASRRIVR